MDYDGVAFKNVSIVELAQLHALLTRRTIAELLPEYKELASASDEGPWVYRIPDALTRAFAQMNELDVSNAAAEWLRTEELQAMGWDEDAALETLMGIRDVARKVVPGKTALLLWNAM